MKAYIPYNAIPPILRELNSANDFPIFPFASLQDLLTAFDIVAVSSPEELGPNSKDKIINASQFELLLSALTAPQPLDATVLMNLHGSRLELSVEPLSQDHYHLDLDFLLQRELLRFNDGMILPVYTHLQESKASSGKESDSRKKRARVTFADEEQGDNLENNTSTSTSTQMLEQGFSSSSLEPQAQMHALVVVNSELMDENANLKAQMACLKAGLQQEVVKAFTRFEAQQRSEKEALLQKIRNLEEKAQKLESSLEGILSSPTLLRPFSPLTIEGEDGGSDDDSIVNEVIRMGGLNLRPASTPLTFNSTPVSITTPSPAPRSCQVSPTFGRGATRSSPSSFLPSTGSNYFQSLFSDKNPRPSSTTPQQGHFMQNSFFFNAYTPPPPSGTLPTPSNLSTFSTQVNDQQNLDENNLDFDFNFNQ